MNKTEKTTSSIKKTLWIIALACLMLVSLTACGGEKAPAEGGDQQAAAQYNWKFVCAEPQNSNQDVYAQMFKENIERISGGKVKVDIYYLGQLGNGADQASLIQNGAIEMGFLPAGDAGSMVPESNIFSLHYLFPSDVTKAKELLRTSKVINQDIAACYEAKGMKVIDWLDEGFMQVTANKEIKSAADFKGLKIRVMASPVIGAAYEAYGCNATNIAFSELYSALQLSMVQGQTNPVETVDQMKYYEVQSNLIITNTDMFLASLIVNDKLWQSLPADVQGYFTQAVEETQPKYNEKQIEMSDAAIKSLEGKGMKVNYLSDEAIAELRELSKKAYDTFYEQGGPNAKKLLEDFIKEATPLY